MTVFTALGHKCKQNKLENTAEKTSFFDIQFQQKFMQGLEAVTVLAFAKHHFDFFVHRPQNSILLKGGKIQTGACLRT